MLLIYLFAIHPLVAYFSGYESDQGWESVFSCCVVKDRYWTPLTWYNFGQATIAYNFARITL